MGSHVSMAYSCKQGESDSGNIFIKMECRELSIPNSKYLPLYFTCWILELGHLKLHSISDPHLIMNTVLYSAGYRRNFCKVRIRR